MQSTATHWGTMPPNEAALQAAIARSQQLLHRNALVAGAASAVPVPGLDWAVDAALLSKLLPKISHEFGLSPEQLDALDPRLRAHIEQAVGVVGSVVIGKLLTRQLIFRVARTAGARLGGKQVAKFVPFAGQIISASVGYAALRFMGHRHIQDCAQVVRQTWAYTTPPAHSL